jgi:hypothetical protein
MPAKQDIFGEYVKWQAEQERQAKRNAEKLAQSYRAKRRIS